MNKHDELIERLREPYTQDQSRRAGNEKEAADLLQLYGDALVRLGDETAMTGRARNDSAWAIGENNARVKYARKTVERACVVNG